MFMYKKTYYSSILIWFAENIFLIKNNKRNPKDDFYKPKTLKSKIYYYMEKFIFAIKSKIKKFNHNQVVKKKIRLLRKKLSCQKS